MKYRKTYVIKHMSVAKSCILQYFTRVRITKNFIIFENQVKHKFRVKEYLIQQIDYLLVLTVTQGRTMYNMIKHLCSIQQNDTQKYLNKKLGEILLCYQHWCSSLLAVQNTGFGG